MALMLNLPRSKMSVTGPGKSRLRVMLNPENNGLNDIPLGTECLFLLSLPPKVLWTPEFPKMAALLSSHEAFGMKSDPHFH